MARNLILVLAVLLATTTLCHGARPFLTALLTSDPYAAQALGIEAGNGVEKNQLAEAEVAAADNDNTASVAGATEIVSTAANNDNVASAIPRTMTAGVDSDSVRFLTASVSLPGSDNVIEALNVPRRKGSLVSVIDDPTDNTASVGASTSSAVIDDPADNSASASTTVSFDDPTDNSASVGASASAAVIDADLSDNTASAATTVKFDDPTDNTASAGASAASAAVIVDDLGDNTASARESATTTAYVSLPGSDNEIYAYRVPARREGMLVVVNGEGSS
ncbi:unnamed protein product [Closterium sp. Yama58-4]|nr:unnamed protein product [Closterium sp. Yama58-4]